MHYLEYYACIRFFATPGKKRNYKYERKIGGEEESLNLDKWSEKLSIIKPSRAPCPRESAWELEEIVLPFVLFFSIVFALYTLQSFDWATRSSYTLVKDG